MRVWLPPSIPTNYNAMSGDLITGVYKMPLSCGHISDTSDMSCQVTYDLKICRHDSTRSLVHTDWYKLLAFGADVMRIVLINVVIKCHLITNEN